MSRAAARLRRLPAPCPGLRSLGVRAAAPGPAAAPGRLRSMEELPGPSMTTTLYWLFVKGYAERSHLLQGLQRSIYGPIWRSRFGPFDMVNVASPELIEQVIRQEGRYPVRVELPHWKEYRDMRGQAYGLHVDTGPEWHRLRSALNPRMLKLQEVSACAPILQQVVGDLLQRIQLLRSRSRDGCTVPDVAAELYKFGFEGISSILFERRLGCLQEEIPADTLRFIAATSSMLTLSETVVLFPRWSRGLLPLWSRFVQAWDDLYDVARGLIDSRIAELEEEARGGGGEGDARGLFLTYLLSCEKLSRPEVYITVTELLLGGVDTTSNTLSWSLYHLARDQAAQARLHQEVSSVCPGGREPSTADLSRMPFLKAVIKETLRLYPVVPGNGRFVSENEVVVDSYWFPKKTLFHLCHYAVCHDEEEFVEPELFVPERWLRCEEPAGGGGGGGAGGGGCRRLTGGSSQHHPYSFIPFGVGVRACVGKRVAEMEMYFALSRIMQHYEVQLEDTHTVVEPKTRTLLIPSRPINLRFLSRA